MAPTRRTPLSAWDDPFQDVWREHFEEKFRRLAGLPPDADFPRAEWLRAAIASNRRRRPTSAVPARGAQRRGGLAGAITRRKKADRVRRAIQRLQGEKRLSLPAAARLYLTKHYRDWVGMSDREHQKKTKALVQQYQRARARAKNR